MDYKLVFHPELRPIRIKTNINKITQYVAKRVTGLGYNVYVSYSNKSRSRYLEIVLSKDEKVIVRISDHVADKKNRWQFRFDIHTTEKRRWSVDYIEFIDAFKQIVGYKRQEAESINSGEYPGRKEL